MTPYTGEPCWLCGAHTAEEDEAGWVACTMHKKAMKWYGLKPPLAHCHELAYFKDTTMSVLWEDDYVLLADAKRILRRFADFRAHLLANALDRYTFSPGREENNGIVPIRLYDGGCHLVYDYMWLVTFPQAKWVDVQMQACLEGYATRFVYPGYAVVSRRSEAVWSGNSTHLMVSKTVLFEIAREYTDGPRVHR